MDEHDCEDAREVVKKSYALAYSRNITVDAIVDDMLTNIGQLGWCLIRAEDV